MVDVDGCHFSFGVADGLEVSDRVAFPARRVSGWAVMARGANFEITLVASGSGWLGW